MSWGKGIPGDGFNPGQVFPENATDSSWGRLEPLMTPDQLRIRMLFGLSLVSRIKDPITHKPMVMTDEIIKDYIRLAVNEAEELLDLIIFPTKFSEKLAFDRCDYEAWGYMKLSHRPVYLMERLTVMPSNDQPVFTVPLTWIETSALAHGQLNLMPLTLSIGNSTGLGNYGNYGVMGPGGGGAGSALFLSLFQQTRWLPSFWQADYEAGFPNGLLPITINEVIGNIAAINILSMIAATWAFATSTSLNVDGLGQSVGTPGPNIFTVRIGELQAQLKMLVNKFKARYQTKFAIGNV